MKHEIIAAVLTNDFITQKLFKPTLGDSRAITFIMKHKLPYSNVLDYRYLWNSTNSNFLKNSIGVSFDKKICIFVKVHYESHSCSYLHVFKIVSEQYDE